MRPPRALERARAAGSRFVRRMTNGVDDWLASHSLVETTEIISRTAFPWADALEARWRDIRAEMDAVLGDRDALPAMQSISPTQYTITRAPIWKVYLFRAYGERAEENCRRCPVTAALIDQIPDLEVAFFSILEPGAHLRAHRGFYKGLVRAHLGLRVPEPRERVRIRVGRETIHWREGELVLFDDTYRHEAWNQTDGVRVVLLIDVARPFPPRLARLNKAFLRLARLTPLVRTAVRNHRAWEKAYYAGGGPERGGRDGAQPEGGVRPAA
jgi:aspartyl/asparaginyl beta-hydroxylase (cupin superfamily)